MKPETDPACQTHDTIETRRPNFVVRNSVATTDHLPQSQKENSKNASLN